MHKTLVLGVLFVFALSVQVPSENHQLTSTSETETISAAGTPQETSVSPKTDVPKTPAVAKAPQVNPSLVAVRNMADAASQMFLQYQRYQREMAKITQDPTMMQNPIIRDYIDNIMDPLNTAGRGIHGLLGDTAELRNRVIQVLNGNKTN